MGHHTTDPHGLLDGGEEVLRPHGECLLLPEVEVLGVVVHQLRRLCFVYACGRVVVGKGRGGRNEGGWKRCAPAIRKTRTDGDAPLPAALAARRATPLKVTAWGCCRRGMEKRKGGSAG